MAEQQHQRGSLPQTVGTDGLLVLDEYGFQWRVSASDGDLYECAMQAHKDHPAAYPVIPLRSLAAARGWGWWTVIQNNEAFLANHDIRMRDSQLLPEQYALDDITEQLLRYGGSLSYLEGLIGQAESTKIAAKESAEIGIAIALVEDATLTGARYLKEAGALARSATFREARRQQIEAESLLAYLKGLRDSYRSAYEAVSRILTAKQLEAHISGGRTL